MAIARQIAEAYFAAALDRGDLEDALRQLRHDVEFASPAAQIRGRDELRPYLEEFARAFPDARYKLSWGVESGSRVALEGVYSATDTGTLRMPDGSELAATGRHVSVPSWRCATCRATRSLRTAPTGTLPP